MIENILQAGMAALSFFGADSQHNRLLSVAFPHGDGSPHAVMLVNTVRMREELSRDFRTEAAQHDETDYNHLHRRWEDAGLCYSYTHRADGHPLNLSDNSMQVKPIDAPRAAELHAFSCPDRFAGARRHTSVAGSGGAIPGRQYRPSHRRRHRLQPGLHAALAFAGATGAG